MPNTNESQIYLQNKNALICCV